MRVPLASQLKLVLTGRRGGVVVVARETKLVVSSQRTRVSRARAREQEQDGLLGCLAIGPTGQQGW